MYSDSLNKRNSESHISMFSDLLFNVVMKKNDQRRRDNLILAMKRAGNAAKLAAAAETSPAYLSQIKNQTPDSKTGVPKTMGDDVARRIEAAIGVDPGWMDQDHGSDVRAERGELLPVSDTHLDNPNIVLIPKVTIRVAAGITGFSVDGSDDVDLNTYPLERSWVQRNGYFTNKLLAMRVKGDSMFPLYREGDIIIINTADTKPVDTKEYVVNFDGDVVLKRLSREGGSWWLTSDNPEPKYHRRSVRGGETIIIGRVVKHDRIDL